MSLSSSPARLSAFYTEDIRAASLEPLPLVRFWQRDVGLQSVFSRGIGFLK